MSALPNELAPLHRLYVRPGLTNQAGPAVLYLAQLRPSGRRTMRASLDKMARMLSGPGHDARTCPWDLLTYEHAVAVRTVLEQVYAPAYVNRHLTALRGVARECWRLGIMDGDTKARISDVPNVKARKLPAGRMLQRWEISRLWSSSSARDRALLSLLFGVGLRRSEASGLRCRDVEEVSFDHARVWVYAGKGGKDRTVTCRGTYAAYLLGWKGRRKEGGLEAYLGLTPSGIYEALRRLTRKAGVAKTSPHDLRRSFISHSLDAGADLATVARLAGHSDPRSTVRYDRRSERAEQDAAAKLDHHMNQDKRE